MPLAYSTLLVGLVSFEVSCLTASNAPVDEMAAFKAKVDKLTIMKNSGLISAEEFESLKKQLLATIL